MAYKERLFGTMAEVGDFLATLTKDLAILAKVIYIGPEWVVIYPHA